MRQSPVAAQANHELPAASLCVAPAGDVLYLLGFVDARTPSFAGLPLPPAIGTTDALIIKCDGLGRPRWVQRKGNTVTFGGTYPSRRGIIDSHGSLTVGSLYPTKLLAVLAASLANLISSF